MQRRRRTCCWYTMKLQQLITADIPDTMATDTVDIRGTLGHRATGIHPTDPRFTLASERNKGLAYLTDLV